MSSTVGRDVGGRSPSIRESTDHPATLGRDSQHARRQTESVGARSSTTLCTTSTPRSAPPNGTRVRCLPVRPAPLFMVVEIVARLAASSLALLSDAGHMVTDVIGSAWPWRRSNSPVADRATSPHLRPVPPGNPRRPGERRPPRRRRLLRRRRGDSALRWRAGDRRPDDVDRRRCRSGRQPRRLRCCAGSKESLNVEGAYPEVLSDTVGSVAVIAGAVVISITGWSWVDPVIAIAIGVWILPRAWRLRQGRCASSCNRRRRDSILTPSPASCRQSTGSSTSTTSTSGR